MKVKIKLNTSLDKPLVIIETPKITEDINKIVDYLSNNKKFIITGSLIDELFVLNEEDIVRIYAENKKILAKDNQNIYTLKLPLYELEKRLSDNFLRISNSEIINIRKIRKIDLSFTGTICLNLTNGDAVYCSRRYITKIKENLGL